VIQEAWRVATRTPTSPAHLIVLSTPCVLTACGWAPTRDGVAIDRTEVLRTHRFACRKCMSVASGRPLRRAA